MEIDSKAWKILECLQQDARLSLTELARAVEMSVPAVSERVKRLEEAGVIQGYHARLSPAKAGYTLSAMVGITVAQPYKKKLLQLLEDMPEVLECHHVTGADSYLFRLLARDVGHLETLVARVNHLGETRTSIILSTPIAARPLRTPR
ncbi:Lrp/AsnC family transcriptional regulator [Aquitalea aquatica]|uniref:Lrp/AsnC family transcriptional regulator n=1 Tax=Aquitalea aquatica TaxID=3044273 RepID=A0A838Y192_9NEIS|nr:Lrp/AsnC family transcriptional regulator [Aquitalea magnusonii]MBA4708416.1 Lrp/AsnC family transcriptional regulator [Aquitalea magnusonii]